MNLNILLPVSILVFFGLSAASPRKAEPTPGPLQIDSIYMVLNAGKLPLPGKNVFDKAMMGFYSLAKENSTRSKTISIIDFTLPSTKKRLWVIDLSEGRIVHHSLVAHGKNSGELYAREFSNAHDSNKSSLGFFLTGKTYRGKHGLSLKLHGLEPGINDQAESRAIVIHGAEYVNEEYAKKAGRLGRSWGCPAIPMDEHKEIINFLANGTCVFIYYPDRNYLSKSRFAGT